MSFTAAVGSIEKKEADLSTFFPSFHLKQTLEEFEEGLDEVVLGDDNRKANVDKGKPLFALIKFTTLSVSVDKSYNHDRGADIQVPTLANVAGRRVGTT